MNAVRNERGETLMELLITIVVIGIGLVAVVGMMGSSIIASDAHRGMAQGEVVIRDFGEVLKERADTNRDDLTTAGNEYVPCPDWTDTAFFNPATAYPTPPRPSGWNVPVITKVEYWLVQAGEFPSGSWESGGTPYTQSDCEAVYDACDVPGLPACDAGFQRVTYTVSNQRTDYAGMTLTGRVLLRRANDVTP